MTDAEFRRQIERELDHASWRSVRPLFLAMVLVLVCIWAASSKADSVTVSWTPPTQNTDGTPLTNLAGYRVLYGTSASSLTQTVQTPQNVSRTVIDGLAPGQWFFGVTAFTSSGVESALSNIASKTIAAAPKMLVTVGGPVFVASPDWTHFGWKLGAEAGTIAARQKCDVTRKIGDDFYRVTSPIVWKAGKKNYVVAKCGTKS